MKTLGTVYLVGAGPGDPGLLTVRGAELLGRADVVVYDALVNPELLRLAPRSAEIVFGGKRAGAHVLSQQELNQMLIAKAREGKTVVRLKGGDPYVFGRGGEEAEQLADAGIPFEVVPGVSSFVAVPNYAGVPLTHRDCCSRLTLLTGHDDPARESESIDWAHLAKTPGTKVIMMGTQRIGQIAERLVAEGMEPSTPIAVVQWGTTDRQRSVEGTLATIGQVVAESQIGPPTVAVIGEVVKLRSKLNWFERRSLFGRRLVVTRAREQASQLSRQLRELGAEVLEVPTITFEPPTRREDIVDALLELNSYDWLVFTSPNGVTKFFEYFFRQFHDMRDLGGARIAAIGPGTARKLQELHLQVDLMPEESLASSIAQAFAKFESIENLKICLLRAEVANPELPRALEALGAIVDDIACYRTVPDPGEPGGDAAKLIEQGADWLTFTSASTVEQFHARFDLPALLVKHPRLQVASIGPETSKALAVLGIKPRVEAKPHTIEGLVAAVLSAI
ncbi:MAG TPA: uroporphyrinogen-III C-methyltransferase [Verrucomicrobiota bacterium]|jgi:uroporphyrinogen III methyltransferase/synthase|nr:uroporphyrinogen-III C-methyltransferase [Verrucomicrobiota bacterium]HRT56161.1 uroporphyrinogen-III C-methyltransferase [Candidatus Paceibacterota bacterium]